MSAQNSIRSLIDPCSANREKKLSIMVSQRKAGAILGYANIIVKNLVNLVYTPMLLAYVGQADYGVYQTANSFVFTLTLLTFGFSNAYIRFYTQMKANGAEKDVRALNGMYLVLYIVVCVVALLLGLLFAANVGSFFAGGFTSDEVSLAGQLMVIMTVNVAATLFSTVFDAYIMVHEQFKFQQTRQMFTTLATPCIAFLLLNFGMGAIGVAVAQLTVTFVLLALNVRFAVGKLKMRFSLRRFDGALFRAVAAFSAWIFANQICELVNQSLPNILLGAVTTATVVAVFAVSIQIRQVFFSLSTTLSSVFVPLINRIVAESDDNEELTRLMARVGRYQAVLYLWVLGGFALVGQFFITAWAGEGFSDAYWLILVMATPLFIPLVQNTGIEIQRAKNRHKARSVCYLCTAALNVVLTLLLAPTLSYWAPALGYVAHVVLGCGLFMNWYYQARIGLDMGLFWRLVLPVVGVGVLATAVCATGTLVLPVAGWLAFFGWGIAYTFVYALSIWVFVLTGEEKQTIKAKLRRA